MHPRQARSNTTRAPWRRPGPAQHGFNDRPSNLQTLAAMPIGARQHAQAGRAILIYPAARSIAGLVHGARDIATAAQLALQARQLLLRPILGRTQAKHRPKSPLQMGRAEADLGAQRAQAVIAGIQQAADLVQSRIGGVCFHTQRLCPMHSTRYPDLASLDPSRRTRGHPPTRGGVLVGVSASTLDRSQALNNPAATLKPRPENDDDRQEVTDRR